MSKERLEEIKKHRNEADNCTDEYEFEKINFYNLHVDWLIEQAGRVQELEEEIEDWRKEVKKWQRFFREESQKNKRYRKALEEIARGRFPGASYKARKALEESK